MEKSKRGGARPGAGRPTECGEPMSRVQVSLDQATVTIMRAFGGGNVSAGIRKAARVIESQVATTEKEA